MNELLPIVGADEYVKPQAIRSCGACMSCCTYFKINQPDLKKEGLKRCKHAKMHKSGQPFRGRSMKGDNCKVHNSGKPKVCKSYVCLWLAGHGDEEDRPDRSGMLIDTLHAIPNMIEAKPLWEDAGDSDAGREAVTRISRSVGSPCMVANFKEVKIVRVVGRGAE